MDAIEITVLITHDEDNGLVSTVHPTPEDAYETLRKEFLADGVVNPDAEIEPLKEGASINEIIDAASALPQFAFDCTVHTVGGYGWKGD